VPGKTKISSLHPQAELSKAGKISNYPATLDTFLPDMNCHPVDLIKIPQTDDHCLHFGMPTDKVPKSAK
ncbi:MAG: hypothetical protein V3U36_06905, partial [Anaerolineales bacterium]